MFVGRQRELAELRSALDAAVGGHGGVALVAGEPGIGKTRLVEKLIHAAEERGLPYWWGRCSNGEGAPPYWPWTQVLRAAGPAPDDLGPLVGGTGDAPEDPADRFRLFDAASRHLHSLGPAV